MPSPTAADLDRLLAMLARDVAEAGDCGEPFSIAGTALFLRRLLGLTAEESRIAAVSVHMRALGLLLDAESARRAA